MVYQNISARHVGVRFFIVLPTFAMSFQQAAKVIKKMLELIGSWSNGLRRCSDKAKIPSSTLGEPTIFNRSIAQPGSALALGARCRRFESSCSDHLFWTVSSIGQSNSLLSCRLQVRVLHGSPFFI